MVGVGLAAPPQEPYPFPIVSHLGFKQLFGPHFKEPPD